MVFVFEGRERSVVVKFRIWPLSRNFGGGRCCRRQWSLGHVREVEVMAHDSLVILANMLAVIARAVGIDTLAIERWSLRFVVR